MTSTPMQASGRVAKIRATRHNDVHSDAGVRTGRQNPRHPFLVQFAPVPTLHFAEHFVVAALERDVEVGNKTLGRVREINDFVAQKVGLNGGNADPVQSLHGVQGVQQVQKSVLVAFVAKFTLSVISNIHPGEHHLLNSLVHNGLRIANHRFHRRGPADAPCQGNGAVGAFVIALIPVMLSVPWS